MEALPPTALLLVSLLAVAAAYLGILGLLGWSRNRRLLLDIPNERSSHARPTPRGGGLAIVLITLLGAVVYVLWAVPAPPLPAIIWSYAAGGALIAVVSWLDDWRTLSNRVRFAAHFVAALLAVGFIGSWQLVDLPLLGTVSLGWLGVPLTLLWVVGLTNAYNFMDGIDGLAGSQAVVTGTGYLLLGLILSQPPLVLLGALVAAASLGFLGHNWHPARIFMGDVGSAFLGYSFAVLPLVAVALTPDAWKSARVLVTAVLFVWPFLFDAGFTFLRRLLNREKVWEAHRSHLYQRLIIAGYAHDRVTLLYAALATAGVGLGLAWFVALPVAAPALALGLPLMAVGLWKYVSQQETRAVTA